jgi:hypothetical protein
LYQVLQVGTSLLLNVNFIINLVFDKFEYKYFQMPGLGNKSIELIVNDYIYLCNCQDLGYWDVCAGHALCKELGGGLFYFNGIELAYPAEYNKFINGNIYMSANKKKIDMLTEKLKTFNFEKI